MSAPLPPSQESFESVFSLQRRIEPDRENHLTSSFSVLDNNTLDIRTGRSKRPLARKTTAQYKGNMSCFSLAGTRGDLGHDGHLALSPTIQELAGAILNDSRVTTYQLGNSSATKPPSSVYSHSLLQPIYVPVTRVPASLTDRMTNTYQGGTWYDLE